MNMTVTQDIELAPFDDTRTTPNLGVLGSALPFLSAVKVRAEVRVGGAALSVGELLALKHGAVLALDRAVEQPLDVVVDGHVVARGMLVAVGDQFGLRLTETPTIGTPAGDV